MKLQNLNVRVKRINNFLKTPDETQNTKDEYFYFPWCSNIKHVHEGMFFVSSGIMKICRRSHSKIKRTEIWHCVSHFRCTFCIKLEISSTGTTKPIVFILLLCYMIVLYDCIFSWLAYVGTAACRKDEFALSLMWKLSSF